MKWVVLKVGDLQLNNSQLRKKKTPLPPHSFVFTLFLLPFGRPLGLFTCTPSAAGVEVDAGPFAGPFDEDAGPAVEIELDAPAVWVAYELGDIDSACDRLTPIDGEVELSTTPVPNRRSLRYLG